MDYNWVSCSSWPDWWCLGPSNSFLCLIMIADGYTHVHLLDGYLQRLQVGVGSLTLVSSAIPQKGPGFVHPFTHIQNQGWSMKFCGITSNGWNSGNVLHNWRWWYSSDVNKYRRDYETTSFWSPFLGLDSTVAAIGAPPRRCTQGGMWNGGWPSSMIIGKYQWKVFIWGE